MRTKRTICGGKIRRMWRSVDDRSDLEKRQNRVLCLDLPDYLYILAYESDES